MYLIDYWKLIELISLGLIVSNTDKENHLPMFFLPQLTTRTGLTRLYTF